MLLCTDSTQLIMKNVYAKVVIKAYGPEGVNYGYM